MARHHGALTAAEVEDRAVTVRPSASANFYVDSVDKPTSQGSGDFIITKNQSLFNGFFHRIATAEVVMDWGLPNVSYWWGNDIIVVYLNNAGVVTGPWIAPVADGFYTSLDILERIADVLNGLGGITATFSVGNTGPVVSLGATQPFLIYWSQTNGVIEPTTPTTNPNYQPQYALARQLFSTSQLYQGAVPPALGPLFTATKVVQSPLVLGTRYVDIVSPQLTYNQDLKDNTTSDVQRDVLYRWYLAWDTPPENEQLLVGVGPAPSFIPSYIYPFPVYQGYRPFVQRRALPYPKQIMWNSNQPIGQASFQVYDDRGRLIDTTKFVPSANFQFQMSMLLSEN